MKLLEPLIFITIVLSLIIVKSGTAQETDKLPYTLRIATVLDAPKTTIAFTIQNNGQKNLGMVGPGANNSPIVIVTPNGKVIEHVVNFDLAELPTKLKPSESKTWKDDNMSQLFKFYKLEEVGLYKVYWKLTEWTPKNERVEYKSNEIFLLKEEG